VSVQTGNSNYYFLGNISADATVTVEFEPVSTELYNVIFDIKNQDGDAITDAIVSLGEQTNEAGNYSFEVLSGAYNLTVVAQGYEIYLDNNFLVTSDLNMPIVLNLIELYTINFVVKDEDEQEVTNAIITLGDQTNEQGNYEFEIEAGIYNLSIIAQGYETYLQEDFEVSADETVSISLNSVPVAQLPIDFSGPWKGELPSGWTENGLGADYANGSAKLDHTGDWLMVHFNDEAAKMSHIIKANGQWNGKFMVKQSSDGQNWTEVVTYEGEGAVATTDTEFEYNLNSDTRYLKWEYTEKISGNTGIANIKVMLPTESYLVSYEVIGENGSLTASVGEEEFDSGTQVEEGSTVIFKAMPDETYRVKAWYLNSQIVENQTSVYYIVNDISEDVEVKVEFEIDDTSIEENEIQTSIYPNPSNGKITIISNAICNMEVVDIQGRILHTSQILSGSNNLDLSHLNKGIYIVRLYNNQGTTSKTIIITD
ncbi:MAG: T9SS type A sorting domain-containing protein, partial [Bacteroidales bacterium]|nr:T9SS type A sorting domain-containing protein [Bacteroidales bacterium]